jgi:hypothetical protein
MRRYSKLLSMLPSARDASAIDIDIPRTFKGDESFSSRVNNESMRRVLYSYSSHCHEQGLGLSYIQGLNVICGMLLFNNSELNAFFCLCAFTLRFAPSHYVPNIAGAHRAASCCDELLGHVDAEANNFNVSCLFFWDRSFSAVEFVALATWLLLCGTCSSGNLGEFLAISAFATYLPLIPAAVFRRLLAAVAIGTYHF